MVARNYVSPCAAVLSMYWHLVVYTFLIVQTTE